MTYSSVPKPLVLFMVVLVASVLAACSDDPAPKHHDHYYHPMISSDQAWLFAGHEAYVEGEEGSSTAPNFVIRSLTNDAVGQSFVYIPAFSARQRYWIEPATASIVISTDANNGQGWRFHDRTGAMLGLHSLAQRSILPHALCFDRNKSSFLWAGGSAGRIVIGRVSYSTQPWNPTGETVILDTMLNATVLDICFTSDVTYGVHLSDGRVREYNMSGALLHEWLLKPRTFDDLWQARLTYKESLGERRLFVLDDSGIVMMDIRKHTKTVITSGIVRLFAVNPSTTSDLMAYETRSGDVWTAYIDGPPVGLPRSRLRMQHAPFFAQDGSLLATVARINWEIDTLAVRKSPFLF